MRYVSSSRLAGVSGVILIAQPMLTCQLLLKFVARVLDTLASSLNVVYRDTNVTETSRIFVAIVDGEVRVVFCSVVVCEFQNAFSVGPVRSCLS